jgi:hypothetical protein
MSEVAQREAETLGLANNQSALLKAAAEPPERQVEKLRELADPPIPGPEREVFATLCVQLNEIISAAKKAGLHEFADALKGTRSILDETGKRLFARSEGDAPI